MATTNQVLSGDLPDDLDLFLLFTAWLGKRRLQPDSIANYLTHVRRLYKIQGLSAEASTAEPVKLLRKAIRRHQVINDLLLPKRERDGLAPVDVRNLIFPMARRNYSDLDSLRIWLIILIGVFCLLRSGEMTFHPTVDPYNKNLHIHRRIGSGIKFESEHILLLLPSSKTQQGRPTWIPVSKFPDSLASICPFRALHLWLAATHTEDADSHLFSIRGAPCTKAAFTRKFKTWVTQAGLNSARLSGHSLPIGGLTAYRQSGVRPDEVKVMGRWTSETHLIYWQRSLVDHSSVADRLAAFMHQ